MNFLAKFEGTAYALLRIVIGFLFTCHGTQKLFGAFGGVDGHGGHVSTAQMVFFIGGIIEFAAGLLILVGLFTRIAAFLASGQMAVAYFKYHALMMLPPDPGQAWMHRLFPIVNQGELAVIYCFVFLYIATRGTGKWGIQK
jgi:putative oxidoreductase